MSGKTKFFPKVSFRFLFFEKKRNEKTRKERNMTELELKYGCNPNQKPARIFMENGELPLEVLNGKPGYINFMDALNSWQLVKALKQATGLPAAASFKHVSPAGAALGLPLSDVERLMYLAPEGDLSPIACAYIRARGADRLCSFGDWAALSDPCDADTARFLALEVSDGVIAPDYTPEALEILKTKRKGGYNVVKIDPEYAPAPIERRNIFGITFEQGYNDLSIDETMLENIVTQKKDLPQEAKHDMLLALITLKYTQSNSVCYVKDGQTLGVGAGQQSRIHCTRLAGNKADIWWLRQHPKVLALPFPENVRRPDRDNAIDAFIADVLTQKEKTEWISKLSGVTLGSDAFFPFGDNVERARQSGVQYIAQPGGSIRDDQVIETADKYGMVMAFTGMRLFHH
ncbi:phosphoribosylaminoimidazolecarboxamide formyltransferase [uncultured Oscillibacter sp.]|uniref:phosphoribosylaminoimidazolecarboxamide formyltransferase n=1 Tax=uncultured Oscillibacter sp. TaxID=876091 RepID=UPI00260ECDF2|nr:phosphoribosylaminoimidazolecarboxamide formyltransferase [uncultured Oscillibacter sp.]